MVYFSLQGEIYAVEAAAGSGGYGLLKGSIKIAVGFIVCRFFLFLYMQIL